MIKTIIGTRDFLDALKTKKATFMLALSNTKTANITGITQAGIPGKIYLTPTLDAEFLCTGKVYSLENIAETPKGVPTPALMTHAVQLLSPFGNIELLDLGLEVKTKNTLVTIHSFGLTPSQSIATGAKIDAKKVFELGVKFGKEYLCKDEYLILGESVPSGTTTARATALALGYDAKAYFSSSFKEVPSDIRENTLNLALSQLNKNDDIFDVLSKVSDNMLIFNAGFIMGLENKTKIVLAGGTQMASVLLVLNSINKHLNQAFESSNLALCTTKWIAQDKNSNIKALLELVDFPINAYYVDFDFSKSEHPALKLYDQGEAKEGVGAGGALMYAFLNNITTKSITKQVESFLA